MISHAHTLDAVATAPHRRDKLGHQGSWEYLGVLDRHDDARGQDKLLPRLADVEDVDAILSKIKTHPTTTYHRRDSESR